MGEKKFLAISKREELLAAAGEIYTTEAVIAREVKAAKAVALCGYSDATEADIGYIVNIAKKICSFVGTKLNSFHKVDFSQEEWRLLLLGDILRWSQVIYEKYHKVLGLDPDEYFTYGIERNPIVPSGVWNGGIIREDDYSTFIYSVICRVLGFEVIYKDICKAEGTGQQNKTKKIAHMEQGIKKVLNDPRALLRWAKRIICGAQREIPRIRNCKSLLVRTRIPQKIEDDIISRHPNDLQRLQVNLLWSKTGEIVKKYTVNTELRAQLFDSETMPESEDPFERICFEIITQSICVSAIEAFDEVHMEAKRIAEHVHVEKVYTSACMFMVCFLENLCGVYLKREGAKCYQIQHAFAEALIECDLAMVRAIGFDAELTWGWTKESEAFEYRPRCINRTPECGSQSEPVNPDHKRILVIAPAMEDYNVLFVDYSQMEERYFQFLDCLAPHLYPHVVVRVRESTETEFCRKHQKYKGIHLETEQEVPYEESVRKSGLVISTYYSSCHVEAMCAGIPCVMFECFTFYVINPALQGIADKLKEAGIYYENGSLAADFVSKMEDYEVWWQGEEVQRAYTSYLKSVVGDYKRLPQIWETEFMADCE